MRGHAIMTDTRRVAAAARGGSAAHPRWETKSASGGRRRRRRRVDRCTCYAAATRRPSPPRRSRVYSPAGARYDTVGATLWIVVVKERSLTSALCTMYRGSDSSHVRGTAVSWSVYTSRSNVHGSSWGGGDGRAGARELRGGDGAWECRIHTRGAVVEPPPEPCCRGRGARGRSAAHQQRQKRHARSDLPNDGLRGEAGRGVVERRSRVSDGPHGEAHTARASRTARSRTRLYFLLDLLVRLEPGRPAGKRSGRGREWRATRVAQALRGALGTARVGAAVTACRRGPLTPQAPVRRGPSRR